MKFIDEVSIIVASGHGGPGATSFRREKYIPFGGPDGGDGGTGGSVIFIADEGVNTLLHFRGRKIYEAKDGEKGMGRQMNGAAGEDVILKVPVGTIVKNAETGETLADLKVNGEIVTLLEGGRGGLGNMSFKSSTNQAPEYHQPGLEGARLAINLELKLLANIGLVGLPNAGKSTLISSISAAKPKIADYPFTTLEPNLGVVALGEKTLVVADVPGLIEDASEGKGLGIKFLKHIERTSALVHLVDISMVMDEFEAFENDVTVKNELTKYNEDIGNKKEIICLTKIDALSDEEIDKIKVYFETELDKKVLPISAVSGRNIDVLKALMFQVNEAN